MPEAELERAEADKLATAAANVARWYETPAIAQKTLDWIMLLQTAGAVYGPRIAVNRMRRTMEAAAAKRAKQQAAAAAQGAPIVERDNRPVQPANPAGGSPPPRRDPGKPNGSRSPPYAADTGLSLDAGDVGISNAPLAMIIPEGGFTN